MSGAAESPQIGSSAQANDDSNSLVSDADGPLKAACRSRMERLKQTFNIVISQMQEGDDLYCLMDRVKYLRTTVLELKVSAWSSVQGGRHCLRLRDGESTHDDDSDRRSPCTLA